MASKPTDYIWFDKGPIAPWIKNAINDLAVYGQAGIHTNIHPTNWRKGESTMPKTKTTKPKKLTLKEQLNEAHKRAYDATQRADDLANTVNRQTRQIECLSTDIAWYKDTVRQIIAVMRRT